MAWTLCTEQDVRDIQTMPTTIPDSWSDMVEGLIRSFTGFSDLGNTSAEYTDCKSGDGTALLRTRHSPIIAVSSVTIDGAAVDADNLYVGEYFIELKNGLTFTRGIRNVEITYTAGEGTVPEDIRLAAATMIVAINNYDARGGADASLKFSTMVDDGRDHTRGGEASPVDRMGLVSHLKGIMRTTIYKRQLRIG